MALDSFLSGHEHTFYGKLSGVCYIKPARLVIAALRYLRKGSVPLLCKEKRGETEVPDYRTGKAAVVGEGLNVSSFPWKRHWHLHGAETKGKGKR